MKQREDGKKKMSTLYELVGEWKEVEGMTSDPEIDPQMIIDTLEGIGGEIEEKAFGYGKLIKNIEADASVIEEEIKRLKKRKDALENKVKRLKKALYDGMKLTGLTKIDCKVFSFSIQNNPESVKVDTTEISAEIYNRYVEVIESERVDKRGILKYMKENELMDMPGVERVKCDSLRIR